MNRQIIRSITWALCAATGIAGCGRTPAGEGAQKSALTARSTKARKGSLAMSPKALRPATRARMLARAQQKLGGKLGFRTGTRQKADSGDTKLLSIAVLFDMDQLPLGLSEQLLAVGSYDDGSVVDLTDQVTWFADDPSIIGISGDDATHGLITALGPGGTNVIAMMPDGTSGSAAITVVSAIVTSIALGPASSQVAIGLNEQFQAIGTFSDGSSMDITAAAQWSVDDPGIAAIDDAGFLVGVALGQTNVNCTVGSASASTDVTVSPAVLVALSVSPDGNSLAAGLGAQLSATGIYSDGTAGDVSGQANWLSSDPSIADVDGNGYVTTYMAGEVDISATIGSVSASAHVSATPAQLVSLALSPGSGALSIGQAMQFSVVGFYSDNSQVDLTAQASWTSSDDTIASISNDDGSQGYATANGPGSVTISAFFEQYTASAQIDISAVSLVAIYLTPQNATMHLGDQRQFVALGVYSDQSTQDLSSQVLWDTSDPSVVSVSNDEGSHGMATCNAGGQATLSATLGEVSSSTMVIAAESTLTSLAIVAISNAMAVGDQMELHAMAGYSDGSSEDVSYAVSWSSSDSTVIATGADATTPAMIAAMGPGAATLSADFNGQHAELAFTVN